MRSRPGRNDICHCGSGKKYKKCCLDKDDQVSREAAVHTESNPDIQPTHEGIPEIIDEDNSIDPPDIEPDEISPPLSDEDNPAIDTLWDTQTELFDKKDIDGILYSLNKFIDEHSDLMILSSIEDQIFDIENLFYEQNRAEDYCDLLAGILERAPEFYMKYFGYFDYSRICHVVSNARYTEINSLLARFSDDPVAHIETLTWTIDLLAWIGAESELETLTQKTIRPIMLSDEIWIKSFFYKWQLLFLYLNNLDSNKSTAEIANKIHEFITAEYSDLFSIPENDIRQELDRITNDTSQWKICYNEKKDAIIDFFITLKWQLIKFIKLHYSLGWLQSFKVADVLTSYWIDFGTGETKKNGTYLITEHKLENYLRRLDTVDAVCLLQGVWYFADFLFFNKRIDDQTKINLQNISCRLFENKYTHLAPSNPVTGIITTFPEMNSMQQIFSI